MPNLNHSWTLPVKVWFLEPPVPVPSNRTGNSPSTGRFYMERELSKLLDFVKDKEHLALPDFMREKQLASHARSSSVKGKQSHSKVSEETLVKGGESLSQIYVESVAKPDKFQPFIKEEVLTRIYNDVFPCTAEQFFKFIVDDSSTFTCEWVIGVPLMNTMVKSEKLHVEPCVTFRCALETYIPVTERRHVVPSADKRLRLYNRQRVSHLHHILRDTVDGQCRQTEILLALDIGFGAYFKKWCLLQSRIKVAATDDNKKVYKIMLDAARSYIESRISDRDYDMIEGQRRCSFSVEIVATINLHWRKILIRSGSLNLAQT
ncbi:hypothetical protein PHJA_001473600 [Phtheirospermum japonicum]|uniref:Uncharacterized protein n=1 Tax=Phtheirospermum japonicum TaxID=374723 RepID=A0A830C534_9LAMI|nr:hypothetical protein PHJA_001473600 [Phtheirospermum japonicum]